jgi:hypothetical protein
MASRRTLWISVSLLLVAGAVGGGWASRSTQGAATPTSLPTTTSISSATTVPSDATSSVIADGKFLAEVTEADPSLATYEKKSGNVALRALLTDGTAFCSFLRSDGDIDDAMVSVVTGAQQVEATTKLPMSVTTFNAVDAVALLTLCPSLESSVPTSDLAKIRKLGASLAS